MNALAQLLMRIAGGERLRKAQPQDYRLWFGVLALLPVFLGCFMGLPFGRRILDEGSSPAIWLYMTAAGAAFFITLTFWSKWVPAMASLLVAMIAWSAGFWIAFRYL